MSKLGRKGKKKKGICKKKKGVRHEDTKVVLLFNFKGFLITKTIKCNNSLLKPESQID
jgi:hypothetical protein